jgi:hypothetical protein
MKYKLVCGEMGDLVKIGDSFKTFRGEWVKLEGYTVPHKPSSSGRVSISDLTGNVWSVYPTVIGCRFVAI